MTEDALRRFGEQFDWIPVVEQGEALRRYKHYVVAGMGGSHLGAWLVKRYGGISNIIIHRDYGLPDIPTEERRDTLVILSSYSGTTEETLDAGRVALERGLPVVAATTGGKLADFARENHLPLVIIPEIGLQPRMAVGFSMLATARLMGNSMLEDAVRSAGKRVDPMVGKSEGVRLASALAGKIPLVYSSAANVPVAYIWKIKFNETSKIPSFCNVFPELCHNELSGFDIADSTRDISGRLHAVFLQDFSDHPRVAERMKVAGEMLAERGIPVEHVALAGKSGFEKVFNSAILADWVSLTLANEYGVPNPETPLVAEFKQRIAQ